jgi:lipoprotein-releasing system permease protein
MKVKHIAEISIALLFARWKQTLIAAIGVTFSIALFITLLGFMEGLNGLLDSLVLNRTPHIRLYNDIRPTEIQPIEISEKYKNHHNFIKSIKPAVARTQLHNVEAILNNLEKDDRVAGVAPRTLAQAFYSLGTIELNGMVNGIDVEKEAKYYSFADYIPEGNYMDLKNVANSIILGIGAAEKMLAKIGDVIIVTTTSGDQFPLKVVAYFQTGMADYDKVQSFVNISTTQKILGKSNNYINELQVKLKDLEQAPPIALEYSKIFNLDTEDIQTANAQYSTGSDIRSLISYAVGITLLIVAGFGIYNILNMMIYEKMDTIAILKATGFAGKDVKRVFINIALSIGVFGVVAGSIAGFLLCYLIDHIPFEIAAMPTITTYPIDYGIHFYAIAWIFAIITTYFAGWFPARKASMVDPVVIIRGK